MQDKRAKNYEREYAAVESLISDLSRVGIDYWSAGSRDQDKERAIKHQFHDLQSRMHALSQADRLPNAHFLLNDLSLFHRSLTDGGFESSTWQRDDGRYVRITEAANALRGRFMLLRE